MPRWRSPRAPEDAYGRRSSVGTAGNPRARRMRLSASAKSPAESASVPSRSNSTADTGSGRAVTSSIRFAEGRDVIDGGIRRERVHAGQRLVGHAGHRQEIETARARVTRELRRTNELRPVVRAPRQQTQDILRAEDGERVRLRIAIERGEH